MIKLSEIRLGNIVCCNSGYPRSSNKPEPVTALQISVIGHMPKGECQNYDYVPLDEEWLRRMGFQNSGMYWFEGHIRVWEWGLLRITYHTEPLEDKEWQKGIQMTYVHQLQNYYFALTGEELTIKPHA